MSHQGWCGLEKDQILMYGLPDPSAVLCLAKGMLSLNWEPWKVICLSWEWKVEKTTWRSEAYLKFVSSKQRSFGALGTGPVDGKEFVWIAGWVSDGWEKMRWHLKFVNHFWKKKNTPKQNLLGLVLFVGGFFAFIVFISILCREWALFRITPLEHSSVFLFLLSLYFLLLQLIFSIVLAIFWHSQVLCVEYYVSTWLRKEWNFDLKGEGGLEAKSYAINLVRDFESQWVFLK